ncbi:hypothetical protein ILUMI_27123 [Ignelater luminosus]|uniref:Endonuclease/exonuclease/phosphatase domain-containing protein n=1 Tax=Ignelater luminosus TaxID=2038154 RepID=A0A8K0FYG3_IGNLU|nr:hypothetical protein ILUMI_27123 [Ignelater luminosus]
MVVNLNICGDLLSLVIAYGPNEEEREETKDEFYEALQWGLDDAKGKIIVLGDLNGRPAQRKPFEQHWNQDSVVYQGPQHSNKGKATRRKSKISGLKIEDKQNKYQKKIEEKSTQVLLKREETDNLDKSWHKFKMIILESTKVNLKRPNNGEEVPLKNIFDKNKCLLMDDKNIMNRWRECFTDFLGTEEDA